MCWRIEKWDRYGRIAQARKELGYAIDDTGEVPGRKGIPWVNSENEGTQSLDETDLEPHCNQNEPRRAKLPDCETIHSISDDDHASSVLRDRERGRHVWDLGERRGGSLRSTEYM